VSLKHFSGTELVRIRGGSTVDGDGGSGRATFMTCNVLTVDFLDPDERLRRADRPKATRMGRLSAERLQQFQASGSVVLQDQSEGLSVTADRVVYWKDRNLLGVYGTPYHKAYIVQQKPGRLPTQASVERLFYRLGTQEMELARWALRAR
jgi:hypothetical protein